MSTAHLGKQRNEILVTEEETFRDHHVKQESDNGKDKSPSPLTCCSYNSSKVCRNAEKKKERNKAPIYQKRSDVKNVAAAKEAPMTIR